MQLENGALVELLHSVRAALDYKDRVYPLPKGAKHHGMIMAYPKEMALQLERIAKSVEPDLQVWSYYNELGSRELVRRKRDFQNKTDALRLLIVVDMLREGYVDPPLFINSEACGNIALCCAHS
jgi:type I site-specific restriction-modification system R (restriction) subunit